MPVIYSMRWYIQTMFIWVRYGTRPMNKVWVFEQTPYSLDTCSIVPYQTKNERCLYFLTRSSHIWHNCHNRLQFKLQLECDMGWYTPHGENHCAGCNKACEWHHVVWACEWHVWLSMPVTSCDWCCACEWHSMRVASKGMRAKRILFDASDFNTSHVTSMHHPKRA